MEDFYSNIVIPKMEINTCTVAQTAESLEHQAEEEWSLRSNILPIDSNEIENWCEGVSHMFLSDAFVPVSEEENNTDQKDVENAKSLPEYGRTSDNANKVCFPIEYTLRHNIDLILQLLLLAVKVLIYQGYTFFFMK